MPDADHIEIFTLNDGTMLTLRHIRPEDAMIEQAFVRKLSTQSRYMRFHGTIKELDSKELAKFTNPDPLNEDALIILHKGDNDLEEEIAVARFVIDKDKQSCEFAIVIADAWQGRGVGTKLMHALMEHAQSRKIKQMYGYVLKNNTVMLEFIKGFGFEATIDPDDSSEVLVHQYLSAL